MGSKEVATLVLRVVQFFGSVITLGLSASVANWYLGSTKLAPPSQVNFMIFVPCFSIVSVFLLELTVRLAPRLANPFFFLGIEMLNVLFYFSGMTALAVFISKLLFCRGAVCTAAKAAAGFGGVMFVSWVLTTLLMMYSVFKRGFRRPSNLGAKPEMSGAA